VITVFPTELSNEAINATLIASGITGTKKSTISTCKMDCVNTLKVAQEPQLMGFARPSTER
jgi:hypothetical protein